AESIVLTLGTETKTSDKGRLQFNGSYVVQGQLILRPSGKKDELRIKFNEAVPADKVPSSWDLQIEANVSGDAWLFQQNIAKFAGTLYVDNLEMTAD
ncbi:MAG: hypothetical protein AB7E95_13795, partial [Kiritimatiellales bacterium]